MRPPKRSLYFNPISLRQARHELHLTLEVLAEKLGVSHVAVLKWEKGHCTPNAARIAQIAMALGKQPNDFYVVATSAPKAA